MNERGVTDNRVGRLTVASKAKVHRLGSVDMDDTVIATDKRLR